MDNKEFKMWCQKVLPTVYDNSLSYYELLNKLVNVVNKCIESIDTTDENMRNLYENYTQLQEWVNNYFNNLDVQNEINKKLDEMSKDGSLSALIQPLFDEYKDVIDIAIETQNNEIDVLKSRMDTFASLPDGSTSGDAELVDIRVGYDGTVYKSAGDAVRTQVKKFSTLEFLATDLGLTKDINTSQSVVISGESEAIKENIEKLKGFTGTVKIKFDGTSYYLKPISFEKWGVIVTTPIEYKKQRVYYTLLISGRYLTWDVELRHANNNTWGFVNPIDAQEEYGWNVPVGVDKKGRLLTKLGELNFTGAVEGKYDGSESVTIDIPNGITEEERQQIEQNKNDISFVAVKENANGNPIILKEMNNPISNIKISGLGTFNYIYNTGKNLADPKNIYYNKYNPEEFELFSQDTPFILKQGESITFSLPDNADGLYIKESINVNHISVYNKNSISYTALEDISIYFHVFKKGGVNSLMNNVQLEYGLTATGYEKFKGSINNIQDIVLNEKDYITKKDNVWKKISGSQEFLLDINTQNILNNIQLLGLFTIISVNKGLKIDIEYITPTKKFVEKTCKNFKILTNNNIKSVNHRGFNTVAPENTLPAFKLSKEMGFEYVECDVQLTQDGIPVLIHDETINRTSNGTGYVKDLTFEYLRNLDFGKWKNIKYSGTKIPTFDEFIFLCKNLGLHPYIEIKFNANYSDAEMLFDIVKKYGMINNVTWISGYMTGLERISQLDSHARLGIVTRDITLDTINVSKKIKKENNIVFISANYDLIEEEVKLCSDNYLPIEVWVVNDKQLISKINPYVTGMASDNLICGEILVGNNLL